MDNPFNEDAQVGFDGWPFMRLWYWIRSRDGVSVVQSGVQIPSRVFAIALDCETHEVYMSRQQDADADRLKIPSVSVVLDGKSEPVLRVARRVLSEKVGVKDADDTQHAILSPVCGWRPLDGPVSTRHHVCLFYNCQKKDGKIPPNVTTLPLSKLIEMDDNDKFDDPLFGYYLRRAEALLRHRKPHLLT